MIFKKKFCFPKFPLFNPLTSFDLKLLEKGWAKYFKNGLKSFHLSHPSIYTVYLFWGRELIKMSSQTVHCTLQIFITRRVFKSLFWPNNHENLPNWLNVNSLDPNKILEHNSTIKTFLVCKMFMKKLKKRVRIKKLQ